MKIHTLKNVYVIVNGIIRLFMINVQIHIGMFLYKNIVALLLNEGTNDYKGPWAELCQTKL
jgi:hypothetical protein